MPLSPLESTLPRTCSRFMGVDEAGKAVLIKPRVSRDQLEALIAQLPPCLIGMEARSGAHHWARVFQQYGHTVKIMAAKLVAPYRMSGRRGNGQHYESGRRLSAQRPVLGSRAVIANLGEKHDRFSRWVRNLAERRGYWRAGVAITARIRGWRGQS